MFTKFEWTGIHTNNKEKPMLYIKKKNYTVAEKKEK